MATITPEQAKVIENSLEDKAHKGTGVCLPCMGFPRDPEKVAYILGEWGKRWGSTYEISQDKRFAKFTKIEQPVMVEQ